MAAPVRCTAQSRPLASGIAVVLVGMACSAGAMHAPAQAKRPRTVARAVPRLGGRRCRSSMTDFGSSLFPPDNFGFGADRPSPLRQPLLTEADIPGLWKIFDRLAAREAVEDAAKESAFAPPTVGAMRQPSLVSAALILSADGRALRVTGTTFATGSWELRAGNPNPSLCVVLESRVESQSLTYLGRVLQQGTDSAGMASDMLGGGLRVFGQCAHASLPRPPRLFDEDDAPDDEASGPAVGAALLLAGPYSMMKQMSLGGDSDEEVVYTCEVGPKRGLRD
ncbi:hypothetical protein T492DRAFT_1070592 [Pavlovales sp. CCMP2436]|nr:hypothetical protein T492DRAFT_1070592 [Pavlovales sp. CCMP2436]|eukprot:CAMPEP_0179914520 /NCGR_PEP_ID=MMETSP0983-20121128/1127_1 /TAXON_ID=483367 /ORGANISM="non described non described, Strain CCMP 2436" /LENGTH=279 /DNA_ID=CAMNT_0021816761 /DNA_START=51 /DNA_END=890 /DNA_ORIENTATION=-